MAENQATIVDGDATRDVIERFVDILMRQKKPREAFEACAVDHYIQHNPAAINGAEAAIGFLQGLYDSAPDLSFDIARVIVEGDLGVVHSLVRMTPEDRGMAVVDILRVEGGRIVEHWDVIQPVPETSANGNPMV